MPQQPLAQIPVDADWDWHDDAVCRDQGDGVFFHPANDRGLSRRRREREAKAICGTCPVQLQCLDYSIRAREPYGVWGGLTEQERESLIATIPLTEFPARRGEGLQAAQAMFARAGRAESA